MRIRRILLVSNAFYPEMSPRSYRATELAKEFCRQGHVVIVLSKFRDYNYAEFFKEWPIYLKMWRRSRFPKIPEPKNRIFSIINRGISRALLMLFEYPGIEDMLNVRKHVRMEAGYDLMISFAVPYPVHWGVAWSRSKDQRIADTWVADCGDPYMGDVLDSFKHPFYFKYLEKWFCRNADFISLPVESAIPGYYPEFHQKVRIIPQGFNFDLQNREEVKRMNKVPKFAYAGSFLKGIRDPDLLLKFLATIDLPFKFYVFTDQLDQLVNYNEALNGKLIVSGYIERERLMNKLVEMDFLINFDNSTKLNIPSKLIDYAITGRPVMNIDKSFKIEDLLAFLNGDYTSRMKLPDAKKYHIKNIAQHFLSLLTD